MTEDERIIHIGELKECIAVLLNMCDPAPITTLRYVSPAAALREQADRMDEQDKWKRRAKALVEMKI